MSEPRLRINHPTRKIREARLYAQRDDKPRLFNALKDAEEDICLQRTIITQAMDLLWRVKPVCSQEDQIKIENLIKAAGTTKDPNFLGGK